jgi:heat shock protein HslJ
MNSNIHKPARALPVILTLGVAAIGLGAAWGSGAIASPQSAPYNCMTREVWSPEKVAWCRAQQETEISAESLPTEREIPEIDPTEPELMTLTDLMESLIGTEWLLIDLGGTEVLESVQTTLHFEAGDRLVGSGGCNRYFAAIRVAEHQVAIGAVGATRMACAPEIMNQEIRFFTALQNAVRIEQTGEELQLYSAEGTEPLRFTRIYTAAPR